MIIYKDKDGNMRKGYFPKEKLLAKGAVVNCDETWCRVKVNGKYGKKYFWCMVNKEAKVAVYFYDDGSRGRKVLRDFLGETEIDALQSDGFRSSLSGLLPSGRKNLLPMTIGIKK